MLEVLTTETKEELQGMRILGMCEFKGEISVSQRKLMCGLIK